MILTLRPGRHLAIADTAQRPIADSLPPHRRTVVAVVGGVAVVAIVAGCVALLALAGSGRD